MALNTRAKSSSSDNNNRYCFKFTTPCYLCGTDAGFCCRGDDRDSGSAKIEKFHKTAFHSRLMTLALMTESTASNSPPLVISVGWMWNFAAVFAVFLGQADNGECSFFCLPVLVDDPDTGNGKKPLYEAHSMTYILPAVCITKRHRDAIKLKLYHLHATLLIANWLYDDVT
eukprot:jgi/Psemu1/2116/gm1.2116_g